MPAIFSRLKNWVAEVLTYADLNAEIDNILANFEPAQMDDYSTNVGEMRVQTDPGEAGSESLPTTLAGELERIRFALTGITGKTYWYETPSSTIDTLFTNSGSTQLKTRITSGRVRTGSSQGLWLTPDGAGNGNSAKVKGATTNLVYVINDTEYTISSDVAITGLSTAPSTNNTCLVNDLGILDGEETKYIGEFGSELIVDAMGSEIVGETGKYAGFKINNGAADEYFTAYVESSTKLTQIRRGSFFDDADAPVPRIAIANNDTITLMQTVYVFAKTDLSLTSTNNAPHWSKEEPSSPAGGDYWFDLANEIWKTYNGSAFVDATAAYMGTLLVDDTDCVVALSADQNAVHSDINSVELEVVSATVIRSNRRGEKVSVFGSTVSFADDAIQWDMTTDLDSGVSEAASTTYFLYLSEDGKAIISDAAPRDRRGDRLGLYHPFDTWRCVGQAYNDASLNLIKVISYSDRSAANLEIINETAAGALTLSVLRDPSLPYSFGDDTGRGVVSILPGTSLTISSGSTLGTDDGDDAILRLIGVSNNKRLSLAVGTGGNIQPGDIITTTAEGGAGAADAAGTFYSSVALSTLAAMPLAKAVSNQTTAGTWAAALNEFKFWPFLNMGKMAFQEFTTTGTYVPTRGLRQAIVISIGAGGGGGGADRSTANTPAAAGGGGSGGMCIELFNASDLGATEAVTIGAGGTAGAITGGNGGVGGAVTFGSLHTANGGLGGVGTGSPGSGSDVIGRGGAGGTATNGTFNITGAPGNSGVALNSTTSYSAGGHGGKSLLGTPGPGGFIATGSVSAGNAGVKGGGGGGAAAQISTGAVGGVGGDGYCLVIELLEE